jgi:uncharacterized protein involved in type VI secretion and phage assembly
MSLLDLLQDGGGSASGRKIDGVMVGIVTKNTNDPDGLGRVLVRFPVRESNDESYWARVATLMAGKERGSFFLPEVDDEVLVAFEHGNAEHPYIIGGLWNGKDTPPEANSDGKNNIRKFRSRSGHEILFNDDAENKQEKVIIQTRAGHVITLDDTSGKEKIDIKDKTGGNAITIDSHQNTITISSAKKLSIKAQVIDIEAQGTMTLKANATLTIQGTLVKIN